MVFKIGGCFKFKSYTTSLNDYSLFYKVTRQYTSIVAVYVDVNLITGNNSSKITFLKLFSIENFISRI